MSGAAHSDAYRLELECTVRHRVRRSRQDSQKARCRAPDMSQLALRKHLIIYRFTYRSVRNYVVHVISFLSRWRIYKDNEQKIQIFVPASDPHRVVFSEEWTPVCLPRNKRDAISRLRDGSYFVCRFADAESAARAGMPRRGPRYCNSAVSRMDVGVAG